METDIRSASCAEEYVGTREPSAAPGICAQWFAAYTSSRHEKRVALHFAEREIEAFLPLYATRHRWKNRCEVLVELPLFPNYVFVHMATRERVRILEVPGVLALVGAGKIPAPLPDFEIEALRNGAGRRRIEPHAYLVIGERVRIKAGPMTGMEGVLLRKKNNFRVVLALDVIMRSVAVEVDAEDLEPVRTAPGLPILTDFSDHIVPPYKSWTLG
ncbi:MAG: UpxY family transcription antiterminator [Candidatus Sulfotelmatobacter sp.]